MTFSVVRVYVATPLWGKCEVAIHTLENGTWESSGTPKNSKLACKGQNTSHWGILYTVGKVSKCRCLKWPRMSHLEHLQHKLWLKEGRQFDFRPLKVRNRHDLGVWKVECDTPFESFQGELQVCFRSHPNRRSGREVMNAQSPRSPNWDSFGTPLWEFREKVPFGCKCGEEAQRILYGGRWWLPLSLGRGESNESVLPVACPNTKSDSKCDLTNLLVSFDVGPSN
jgi:hypothetical protein